MMKNDLGATSGERWRKATAAEAADFSQEYRRSRCIRLNYCHLFCASTFSMIEPVI